MKSITVVFENKEFERLTRAKRDESESWHDFIMALVETYEYTDDDVTEISGKLKVGDSEIE